MKYSPVTIAMAVYKPNEEFFVKQLKSINDQDYPNVDLLIWNDSPQDTNLEELVSKYVTKIPYKIKDNGKNNGVTQVFACLTQYTNSKYIAYSDQDDIWMSNKISVMVDFLEHNPNCTCCHSDVCFIDENDNVIRKSIYPVSIEKANNVQYQQKTYFVKNWTVGCAMVMRTDIAKEALPFPDMMYHDVWLAMYALSRGRVCYLPECLIEHRIHSTNNSATLHGVKTKEDYYTKKLYRDAAFLKVMLKRLSYREVYKPEIKWIKAREIYAKKPGFVNGFYLLTTMRIRPTITLFELFLPIIPEYVFSHLVIFIRKEIRKFGVR